jgi:hypothetical protein
MQGYLMRVRHGRAEANSASTGVFGALRKRYFKLQGSFLSYFKSHSHSKPCKDLAVDLRGRVVTKTSVSLGRFGVRIDSYDGSLLYLLFADTVHDQERWVECLNNACGAGLHLNA